MKEVWKIEVRGQFGQIVNNFITKDSNIAKLPEKYSIKIYLVKEKTYNL